MLEPINEKKVQNVEDAFAHQTLQESKVLEDEADPKLRRQHQ